MIYCLLKNQFFSQFSVLILTYLNTKRIIKYFFMNYITYKLYFETVVIINWYVFLYFS